MPHQPYVVLIIVHGMISKPFQQYLTPRMLNILNIIEFRSCHCFHFRFTSPFIIARGFNVENYSEKY